MSGQQFDVVREMFTNSILFPKSAVRTDTLHRLGADLFKQNNPNAHNQEFLPETQGKRRVLKTLGDKFNVDGLIKDDGVVTGIMLAKLSVQSINKNLKISEMVSLENYTAILEILKIKTYNLSL